MAVIEVHPLKIEGLWGDGYALDLQTTNSRPVGENQFGHMQFETERPPIAQLLFRLKYRGDSTGASDIIETAANFLTSHDKQIDIIIPVPPSTVREVQPVLLLADGIGATLKLPVCNCVTLTRSTIGLKDVSDPQERKRLLDGLHAVDATQTRDKNILLFDDLFRSGATMNAITKVLLEQGQAASVSVLTITKTRNTQ